VIANIVDNHWIYLDQVTQGSEDSVVHHFSVRHPKAYFMDLGQDWDGWYRRYNVSKQRLALPFLNELKICCEKNNIPLDVHDFRDQVPSPLEENIHKDMLDKCVLEDYQIMAVKATLKEEMGLLSAPTGAGKCTTGESKIILNGMRIRIDSLFIGFEDEEVKNVGNWGLFVFGPNGFVKIDKLYKTNKRRIYKVSLSNGQIIRGVSDHKLYTKNGWKLIKELIYGDEIHTRKSITSLKKWENYFQTWNQVLQKTSWKTHDDCLYSIRLYSMSEFNHSKAESISPNKYETWKITLCGVYSCFKSNNNKGGKGEKKNTSSGNPKEKWKSNVEKRCRTESKTNMSGEIWSCGSSDVSKTNQGDNKQSIPNQNKKWESSIIRESDREVQKNNVGQTTMGDREYKAKKVGDLEKESQYQREHKRVIFESTQDSYEVYFDEIRNNSIPEQVRKTLHRIMRGIEQDSIFGEGTDNSSKKFVVNKIPFSVFTEEGTNITEKISCGDLCTKEFNDISFNNMSETTGNGFDVFESDWSTVEGIEFDGIENTYDLQILDNSHAYYTNGILSHNTEIMCAITKLYNCPTILVTEQRVVLDQIVERLQLRGVVKDENIGLFCSGHMPDGQKIIVGSIQSVCTPTKPKYSDVKMWEKQALKQLLDLIEKEDREELNHILPGVLVEAVINNPAGIEKLTPKYNQVVIEFFKHKKFEKMLQWYRTRLDHSRDIQAEIKNAQLLLIDEADLATSVQYNTLCRLFNGRRRYGFSGTHFDKSKPVQNLFLRENLGNVIHEVPRSEVQARGRIIPLKCFFIAVGVGGDRHDLRTFDIAMDEEIISNDKFKNMVAKINEMLVHERNLILIDTSPIESLGLSLEKLIPNSKFLFNKSPMSERRKFVKKFENGELQCLIGGKIFKRGLDLKGGVDNLIIIGGGKQWSNINQMIGRGVRINSRGWARVFCFFHLSNKYLYDHSRENLKAVVDLGYPTIVSINGKQVDASRFIHSRYRIKK
jgi:superfamily II DNA or RNA helicase